MCRVRRKPHVATSCSLQPPTESHSGTWQPVVATLKAILGWQVGTTDASSDSAGVNDETGDKTKVTVCALMRRRDVQCPHARRLVARQLLPAYVQCLRALHEGGATAGYLTMSEPLKRLYDDIGAENLAQTLMFAGERERQAGTVRGGNRRRADAAAAATSQQSSDDDEGEDGENADEGEDGKRDDASSEDEEPQPKRQKASDASSDSSDSESDAEGECTPQERPLR